MSVFGPPLARPLPSSNLVPLPPVTVGTADFEVDLRSAGVPFAPDQVLLDNESPYLLRLGLGGGTYYLRPWVSNVFRTGGASQLQVHPIALASPTSLALFSSLLVTLVPKGETAPGLYPMDATRQAAVYSPVALPSIVVATANTTVTQTIAMPAGAYAIGITGRQDHGGTEVTQVKVVGHQSGRVYWQSPTFNPTIAPPPFPIWVNVMPSADTSLDVSITVGAGAMNSQLTALLEAEFVPIAGAVNSPVGQPLPWDAPNLAPIRIAASIAAGGVLDVVAAVVGQSVYVFQLWLGVEGAVNATPEITVQDHAGTNQYHAFEFGSQPVPPWTPGAGKGARLTPGGSLSLHNQDGIAHVCRGSATVSQA